MLLRRTIALSVLVAALTACVGSSSPAPTAPASVTEQAAEVVATGDDRPERAEVSPRPTTGVEALETNQVWELVEATVDGQRVDLDAGDGGVPRIATDPELARLHGNLQGPHDDHEVPFVVAPDCNHDEGTAVQAGDGTIALELGARTDVGCSPESLEPGAQLRAGLSQVTALERRGDHLLLTGPGVELSWVEADGYVDDPPN